MLASIYQAAGYRTAAYTSPHLLHFTERFQIQTQPLAASLWCQAFAEVEQARAQCSLTYFEFITLTALKMAKQQPIDILILEVGLGGRLDAVNVVESDLAIIASIAIDHVAHLGSTREAIGQEKAGIFRPHKPALCGDPHPPSTLLAKAAQLNSPLYCQQRDFFYQLNSAQCWEWSNQRVSLTDLPVPALPLPNAATVLQAVDLLQAKPRAAASH
jgi:dihydrofolate synthase / folylpolyglutamate synthase